MGSEAHPAGIFTRVRVPASHWPPHEGPHFTQQHQQGAQVHSNAGLQSMSIRPWMEPSEALCTYHSSSHHYQGRRHTT
jgi:hypothetical protein